MPVFEKRNASVEGCVNGALRVALDAAKPHKDAPVAAQRRTPGEFGAQRTYSEAELEAMKKSAWEMLDRPTRGEHVPIAPGTLLDLVAIVRSYNSEQKSGKYLAEHDAQNFGSLGTLNDGALDVLAAKASKTLNAKHPEWCAHIEATTMLDLVAIAKAHNAHQEAGRQAENPSGIAVRSPQRQYLDADTHLLTSRSKPVG